MTLHPDEGARSIRKYAAYSHYLDHVPFLLPIIANSSRKKICINIAKEIEQSFRNIQEILSYAPTEVSFNDEVFLSCIKYSRYAVRKYDLVIPVLD